MIINRTSGVGHGREIVDRLRAMLVEFSGGQATLQVDIVDDHPTARDRSAGFLAASEAPALVIAGGGSGTLRAVIEGLCDGNTDGRLPGRQRVRIGALRMGSGNPLARQFGAPHDPEECLQGILENLRSDLTVPCCVMRCEVGTPEGDDGVYFAATMSGFGQFGRTPGDLARLHHRFPGARTTLARFFGIERVNNVEYALALLGRSVRCAVLGRSAVEVVEVRIQHRREIIPLLAGVAMNFPFRELPLDPGTRVEDEAVSLYMLPFTGRLAALGLLAAPRRLLRHALQIRLEKEESVEIRLLDRDSAEFFLDEDPMTFHGRLTLRVAGSLAFVPGPEYAKQTESEV